MNTILQTENLSIGYKKSPLVSGLNLQLKRGEITALIGRNGAGKSTLLRTLTGNLKKLGGRIEIDGRPLEDYARKELAGLLAVVNTDPNMAGGLMLKELVGLGRSPYSGIMGRLTAEDRRIIVEAMDDAGISHKKESFVSELSDGERQKGMIARGLAQQTPLIIMDEPFSFLDVAARLETLALLRGLAREREKAILYSTHDVSEALRMADRIWLFTRDKVIQGEPSTLIENGDIELLFPDSEIKFDPGRGDFYLP